MSASTNFWWGVAWLAATTVVFLGPLVPGLLELRRGRDAKALDIDDFDSGETDYRIKLLAPRLPALSTLAQASSWLAGDRYRLPQGTRLAAARSDLAVSLDKDAVVDILISDRTLEMAEGSQVTHLAHAESILAHGPVQLSGRTSAESLIVLAEGSSAFRVAAPCIVTAPLSAAPETGAAEPPTPLTQLPQRHEGDFTLEAGETLQSSVVVHGDVTLREGARLVGHIKAHGDVELAEGACVAGAIFATGSIRCAGANRVEGPVSAIKTAALGAGTIAGSPSVACSVSGWDVVLGPGVAVFGTVTSVGGCRIVGGQ